MSGVLLPSAPLNIAFDSSPRSGTRSGEVNAFATLGVRGKQLGDEK